MSLHFVDVPDKVIAAYEEVAKEIGVDLRGERIGMICLETSAEKDGSSHEVQGEVSDDMLGAVSAFVYRIHDVASGLWRTIPVDLGAVGKATAVEVTEHLIAQHFTSLSPPLVKGLAMVLVGMATHSLNYALSVSADP